MLQIHHRISYDIDIFIDDPQLLGFLNPETQGYACEIIPSGYTGDGTRFLKIAFADVGEVDFIVATPLTENHSFKKEIKGRDVSLETIGEIITKKVYYRTSLVPRDIFDIAAAASSHSDEVLAGLKQYPDHSKLALEKLKAATPEFVDRVIADLAVIDEFKDIALNARRLTIDILERV